VIRLASDGLRAGMTTDDSAPMRSPKEDGSPPQAPAMQLVYANAAGIRGGAFDCSIEFAYVIPPSEGEEPQPPLWQIRVAMSWEHARALQQLLEDQLQKYEGAVGELPRIENLRTDES
jgi:Protein of unknown function (DUF3467)